MLLDGDGDGFINDQEFEFFLNLKKEFLGK